MLFFCFTTMFLKGGSFDYILTFIYRKESFMKRTYKHFLAAMSAVLVTCTLSVSMVWASISKPSAPDSAVALWDRSTAAAVTPGVVSLQPGELLEADYFGAKFIGGITSAEPFGPWDDQDITRTSYDSESLTSIRISAGDTSHKNNLGIRYKNVGNYKGRSVDLTATLENYEFYSNDGILSQMILWGKKDEIGFCVAGEAWIDIRYEFWDSETGEPLSLKAYMTFDDVDWGQAIGIMDNPGQLYTPSVSNLRCITTDSNTLVFLSDAAWYDDASSSAHASITEDSFMTMFEGSSQLQRFYCCYYFREGYESRKNFLSDYEDEAALQIFCDSLDYFGYSGEPLAPTEPAAPTKQVADSDENGSENTLSGISEAFSYTIYHNVPNENPENYYHSYVLTDTLPDCLELISASVYDESDLEVTADFDIDSTSQTITFSVRNPARADFYYNTYRYVLHVKIRDHADLADYLITNSDGMPRFAFKNRGTVTIERDGITQKQTNETITYLQRLLSGGSIQIHKIDAVSGAPLSTAVFTLYEWNQPENCYMERETLTYDSGKALFCSSSLDKTVDNLGKYKVIETRLPEKYKGQWEQELELTRDGQVFEFEVVNTPIAAHTITKTAAVTDGSKTLSKNPGTKSKPVSIQPGNLIEYQIQVQRDCTPGYKSGTFTVTDRIPKNCIWSRNSLNITGQIIHPIDGSAASIDSMKVENNTIIWTITDLDDGEEAHLSFQVKAPAQSALLENTAYLNIPEEPEVPSNTTYHQTRKPASEKSGYKSNPKEKTGSTAAPVETGDLTPLYSLVMIAVLSGIGIIILLFRKRRHR